MNEYDSAKIINLLQQKKQVQLVKNYADADLLLMNTCSIRDKAYEKVYSQLGRWRKIKNIKPHIKIAIVGCVASQEGELILKRAPYVDVICGPQTYHRLPELLEQSSVKPVVDISFPEIEKFDSLPISSDNKATAYVTIMEGCSKYCSFCVVPYTRGEEISRPFDDILVECNTLAEQGVKEIHLLGQNVNAYRGIMHDDEIADLALLITTIATIDKIKRIRFTTSHPIEFNQRLIDCFDSVKKLVRFVHLPIQSGSDRILSSMKRGHTVLEYKSIIKKLRKVCPDITISSDFIIGYPNESDDDFQQTIKVIQDIGFDNSYSFIYSPRPGTPASDMVDNIEMETKKQRLQILQQLIKKQSLENSQKMVGTTQKILIERHSLKDDKVLSGRTENNKVVNVKADKKYLNQFVDVQITAAYDYSSEAELVNE